MQELEDDQLAQFWALIDEVVAVRPATREVSVSVRNILDDRNLITTSSPGDHQILFVAAKGDRFSSVKVDRDLFEEPATPVGYRIKKLISQLDIPL